MAATRTLHVDHTGVMVDQPPGLPQREIVRELRRQIGDHEREIAARAVVDPVLAEIADLPPGAVIALSFAFDGELPIEPTAERIRADGGSTAYPAVAGGSMEFRRWDGESALDRGRIGMVEPRRSGSDPVAIDQLSLVVVPLVAFDRRCHRVGFGRGFYDRAFASPDRPRLIGVAFDCQELAEWTPQLWDVPLDAVITPTRTITPTLVRQRS